MFETESTVDAVIAAHAEAWRVESRRLVEAAYDAIDRMLGLPVSFSNRSRGQRERHKRQRQGASA